jgi:archaeal flagellin FlaB
MKQYARIFFPARKRKFDNQTIADMGIGAMIVFIAMVLVAGIAASVIIQTANRLESQAMITGQETTREVSTGIFITGIEGHRALGMDHLIFRVQTRAGSNGIDLSHTYMEIANTDIKCVLSYFSTEFHLKEEIQGDFFQAGFFDTLSSTQFGIIVLEDADSSLSDAAPVLNRGDKVMITVDVEQCFGIGLAEKTDIWGSIQSEEGSPGVFSFRTPQTYTTTVVYNLY